MSVACADVTRQLQPLLDDLLEENEYQELHAHLAWCGVCQAHVGAIGSISWSLKRLGDVAAPPDLVETTVFRLRQPPSAEEAAAAQPPSNPVPWTLVLVGAVIAVVAIAGVIVFKRRAASAPEPPVVVSAALDRPTKPPTDEEKAVLGTLASILDSLGGPPAEAPSGEVGRAEPSAGAAAPEDEIPEPPLVHWTLRLKGPRRTQVLDTLQLLNIPIEHESSELLVLAVPQNSVEALAERLLMIREIEADLARVDLSRYGARYPVRIALHLIEEFLR